MQARERLVNYRLFQHTAARRRLPYVSPDDNAHLGVSTHSRAEAAAILNQHKRTTTKVSTHSRAEAAASYQLNKTGVKQCFNTQPRGGGCYSYIASSFFSGSFQHTAARRRLRNQVRQSIDCMGFNTQPRGGGCNVLKSGEQYYKIVSTHSRAEAAAYRQLGNKNILKSFNTQPRGGGCSLHRKTRKISVLNTVFR